MCYTINSETVLANFFARTKKTEVSFVELRNLRSDIETELNGSVYVDIRSDSLVKTILTHRDYLVMEQTKIEITPLAQELFKKPKTLGFIDEKYNWRLPSEARRKIEVILSHYDGEM